jgi:branched-chain amino acid transport system substrate-binding protein
MAQEKKKESSRRMTRRTFLKRVGITGSSMILGGGVNSLFPKKYTVHAAAPMEIKIGALLPLSGPYGIEGVWAQQAGELIASRYSKEGKAKVTVLARDDKATPGTAIARSRELVENDKVDWLIGTLAGHTALAVNQVSRETKVPYMCITQSDQIMTPNEWHKYMFHLSQTNYMMSHAVAGYTYENLGKKWYILIADYAWGQANLEGFKAAAKTLGAQVLGEDKHPLGTTDYSTYIAKIAAANPEVLLLSQYGRDEVNALKQFHEYGLKKKMQIVNIVSGLPIMKETGQDIFEGTYSGIHFYWGLQDKLASAKRFVTDYIKETGHPSSNLDAMVYGGVIEIVEAILRAGTKSPEAAIKAMEGHKFDHFRGPEYWRPCDHQSIHNYFIIKGKPAKAMKGEWDFAEVVGQYGGEKTFKSCKELGLGS